MICDVKLESLDPLRMGMVEGYYCIDCDGKNTNCESYKTLSTIANRNVDEFWGLFNNDLNKTRRQEYGGR